MRWSWLNSFMRAAVAKFLVNLTGSEGRFSTLMNREPPEMALGDRYPHLCCQSRIRLATIQALRFPERVELCLSALAGLPCLSISQRAQWNVGLGVHPDVGAAGPVAAKVDPRPVAELAPVDGAVVCQLHGASAVVTDARRGYTVHYTLHGARVALRHGRRPVHRGYVRDMAGRLVHRRSSHVSARKCSTKIGCEALCAASHIARNKRRLVQLQYFAYNSGIFQHSMDL